jgi:hypothetical protein
MRTFLTFFCILLHFSVSSQRELKEYPYQIDLNIGATPMITIDQSQALIQVAISGTPYIFNYKFKDSLLRWMDTLPQNIPLQQYIRDENGKDLKLIRPTKGNRKNKFQKLLPGMDHQQLASEVIDLNNDKKKDVVLMGKGIMPKFIDSTTMYYYLMPYLNKNGKYEDVHGLWLTTEIEGFLITSILVDGLPIIFVIYEYESLKRMKMMVNLKMPIVLPLSDGDIIGY